MRECIVLFAAASRENALPTTSVRLPMSSGWAESLILFGALLAVVVAAVVWAVYFRPRRRRRRNNYRSARQMRSNSTTVAKPERLDLPARRRGKWRRRRRADLPRNPTRAETGGLPPLRSHPPPLDPEP